MQKTENERPDLALIGAGYWGKNLARNFRALGALRVLCDADPNTLGKYNEGYEGVRKTARVEEVWEDPDVKKVALAAPAALHYELAKAALEAGKDVFVEKPLCLHVEEAEELVALADARGAVLMVGHLLQYHPCVRRLMSLVAEGELGKLYYIASNRLNLGKIRQEENALWSFAPHDLSVILSLVGRQLPEETRCMGEAYLTRGVADATLTALRFPGGVRAHVYVSWLNPFKEQKLTVVGSHGMAVFDDTRPWPEKLVLYRDYLIWSGGAVPTPNRNAGKPVEVEEAEPLRLECAHFLECCRDRRAPRTDGREGLRVLQVLNMAQKSLEAGGEAVGPADLALGKAPSGYWAHPTAVIDPGAEIGEGARVWHFSHVCKDARIGRGCVLGQNTFVASGVRIGNNVKIQNNVSIYTGAEIEDDVFLGPSCVLTNVTNPRSQINRHSLYETTRLRRGATIGANATIVCGVTVGRYAFVGAGAVVTKDVPDYGLVLGNPGRVVGWMSRHGHRLNPGPDGLMVCPESGFRYKEVAPGVVRCLDLDEESPLPPEMAQGARSYREWKRVGD